MPADCLVKVVKRTMNDTNAEILDKKWTLNNETFLVFDYGKRHV